MGGADDIVNAIRHSHSPGREATLTLPRLIGYEILRRVRQAEIPSQCPIPQSTARAVLGTGSCRYLVPPGIDIFELGIIDTPGRFELLPIDPYDNPLWDEVIDLVVSTAQAEQQRDILMRSYHALHALIWESATLHASVAGWSRRGSPHPVFGFIRLETIETWKSVRHGTEPLSEEERDRLHESVARRVALRIRARFVR
jgi:hypothetical protein